MYEDAGWKESTMESLPAAGSRRRGGVGVVGMEYVATLVG